MENPNKVDQSHEKFETVYKPLTFEISKPQLLRDGGKGRRKESLFLYFSSLTADLLMFDCGCNFTWTSPALAALRSTNLDVNPLSAPTTAVEESWLAALINLGAAIGPLAFGKFPDIFGRRKMLILISVLKIISYIILAYAHNINLFYLARFLLGASLGLCFAVMPMYTAEISQDHNRGKLASIMGIFLTLGFLYTLLVGPLLPLRMFTLSCAVFLVVALIPFVLVIPETPVFLVSKGKKLDAKKTLMKLRNLDSETAEVELMQLTKMIEEEDSSKSSFIDIFKMPSSRRGILICVSLCSLTHLSGAFPIMAFIGPIFEITGSQIPIQVCLILVSVVQLIATILSSFTIERLGRKPLLLLSTIGTSISLLSLGFYFYLKDSHSQYTQNIFWLPVTSLMTFILFLNIGLTSVPMAILSEVFASNIRSAAISFVTFFGAITGFAITFVFPVVMIFLGGAICFWMFAGFMVLGTVFIYFVVPETKGRSLSEIQTILSQTVK